jgi:hypothetical protein
MPRPPLRPKLLTAKALSNPWVLLRPSTHWRIQGGCSPLPYLNPGSATASTRARWTWVSRTQSTVGATVFAKSWSSLTVAALPKPRQFQLRQLIGPGGPPNWRPPRCYSSLVLPLTLASSSCRMTLLLSSRRYPIRMLPTFSPSSTKAGQLRKGREEETDEEAAPILLRQIAGESSNPRTWPRIVKHKLQNNLYPTICNWIIFKLKNSGQLIEVIQSKAQKVTYGTIIGSPAQEILMSSLLLPTASCTLATMPRPVVTDGPFSLQEFEISEHLIAPRLISMWTNNEVFPGATSSS